MPFPHRPSLFRLGSLLWVALSTLLIWGSVAYALPSGNAVTNSRAILRMALPLQNPDLRDLDATLSAIDSDLKYSRWSSVQGDISKAQRWLERKGGTIGAALDPAQQAIAQTQVQQIGEQLRELSTQVALKIKGKEEAARTYETTLNSLEQLEELFVTPAFAIPNQYASLPRLLGRAQVEMVTTAGTMRMTLDGFNAPLTAGNFADLVQKGFYNGIEFNRVENFYVIQAGDPPGPAEGYVDPATRQLRTIPLEIRPRTQAQPIYGKTFETAGLWSEEPALPFSARGTVAMARGDDPNSGSSQFFIFFAEPDLTPAGLNLIDGRYAVFGYITQGVEALDELKVGDKILKATLQSGGDQLKAHA